MSWLWSLVSNFLVGLVESWLGKKEEQQEGANAIAQKVTAQTQKVTAAEAQAEADAPKSDKAVEDLLNKGMG